MMKMIDTHCHLDDAAFDSDREVVIHRAQALGVTRMIIPGVTANRWHRIKALCQNYPSLDAAYGLHPLFMDRHQEGDIERLSQWVEQESPVAIGEIGLDLYHKQASLAQQQPLFERQLEIAKYYDLPVLLHVRKAHDQVIALLKKHRIEQGIAHAFSGSEQQARHYLDLGLKLGIGGMVTYERSTRVREMVRQLPIEGLVLETDAPDMVVASHQGERNSPEYLPQVAEALAQIKGVPPEVVAEVTTHNAQQLFRLVP